MSDERSPAASEAHELAHELAEELAEDLLRRNPFGATLLGLRRHDGAVPDLSPAARAADRQRLVELLLRCEQLQGRTGDRGLLLDDALLLDVVRDTASRELARLDAGTDEWTVTTLPSEGLSLLLLLAGLVALPDADAARAWLERLRACPGYLDQYGERLRAAAARGQVAVAPLVAAAVEQHRAYLADPAGDPLAAVAPPAGWAGADAWRDAVGAAVNDGVRPAVQRVLAVLEELLPQARPEERPGLLHVPGGAAAYAAAVRDGTTLPVGAAELHETGRAVLAEVQERMLAIGRRAYGATTLAEVLDRLREQPAPGGDLLARSEAAVRRAEAAAAGLLPAPLPSCDVRAMPPHLAATGAPPMYAPPARDGSRGGAYLVNDVTPGPAAGWALEAVCFHEAVPGHHAQLTRLEQVAELPLLLTVVDVVPYAEGWGLYAEQLADELELYSDDEQRLGWLAMTAWRAVRLVLDTGLHDRGWSREQAVRFGLEQTPLPEDFVRSEVDRYVAWPGQALGYLVGLREIVRLREDARARLGDAFDLRGFHAAVLDRGSLPLPVLARAVEQWVESCGG